MFSSHTFVFKKMTEANSKILKNAQGKLNSQSANTRNSKTIIFNFKNNEKKKPISPKHLHDYPDILSISLFFLILIVKIFQLLLYLVSTNFIFIEV